MTTLRNYENNLLINKANRHTNKKKPGTWKKEKRKKKCPIGLRLK